MKLKECNLPKF